MVIDRILTNRPNLLKHISNRYLIALAVVAVFALLLIAHPQPETVRM